MDGFDFVESPPGQFFCPVTSVLLLQPHQTKCCGHHISEAAVTQLQEKGKPCPCCEEPPPIRTIRDQYFQRKVRALKIRCAHEGRGCNWVGELGNLEQHLNPECKSGCEFVEVSCCYCGKHIQKHQLLDHEKADCPKRPFDCQYCSYSNTFEKVAHDHWPVCLKFKLSCPNQCCSEPMFERQHLSNHLNEQCPLQEVECEFKYIGCSTKLQRRFMPNHLNENTKTHLSMVAKHHQTIERKVEQQGSTIQQQQQIIEKLEHMIKQQSQTIEHQMSMLEQQQQKIEQQHQTIEQHTSELQGMVQQQHKTELQLSTTDLQQYGQQSQIDRLVSTLSRCHVVIPNITVSNFRDNRRANIQCYSTPFYTHIGGYKMCLRVAANGQGEGKGAYISVYVHLMQGEYDDNLPWPFSGKIMIRLLNQKRDARHHEGEITFGGQASNGISSRVTGREVAENGLDWDKFIVHGDLVNPYFSTEYYEYLKNDCLKFQVVKVTVYSI